MTGRLTSLPRALYIILAFDTNYLGDMATYDVEQGLDALELSDSAYILHLAQGHTYDLRQQGQRLQKLPLRKQDQSRQTKLRASHLQAPSASTRRGRSETA